MHEASSGIRRKVLEGGHLLRENWEGKNNGRMTKRELLLLQNSRLREKKKTNHATKIRGRKRTSGTALRGLGISTRIDFSK